jgi:hypothetical protein
MVIDPKEGYVLEAANCAYENPANHAILGPLTDQVFAAANFYLSKKLKPFETGVGIGYNRAKRLWELLIDRQHDSITEPEMGITPLYFMNCFRDHGNLPIEEGRVSGGGVPEERGIKTICTHGFETSSAYAHICISRADYTDLLSCMWMTFGQPCICPFLPFFIGINSVPEEMATDSASRIFEDLRLAVEYHPEKREEITRGWQVFELQAIEEIHALESAVINLIDRGNTKEARKSLTEFTERKCSQALSITLKIIENIQGLPGFPFAGVVKKDSKRS